MTVEIEHFDVNEHPDHGRPQAVGFSGREGTLNVHISREDGSLWMFADGPSGGDQGHVVIPVRLAGQIRTWLGSDYEGAMPSTSGALWLDLRDDAPGRTLVIARAAGVRRRWQMKLDPNAVREFDACLRQWSEAVMRTAEHG